MSLHTVSSKKDSDTINQISDSLGSAFLHDPFFSCGFDTNTKNRQKRLGILFAALIQNELSKPDGLSSVTSTPGGKCAAIWHHKAPMQETWMAKLKMSIGLMRCFGLKGALRLIPGFEKMEAARPKDRHVYLFTLGVDASVQGKGLGSKVIAPMLEKCDREGLPIYLESTNPRNYKFYQRHGFVITGEIEGILDGLPPVVGMWREPRTDERN